MEFSNIASKLKGLLAVSPSGTISSGPSGTSGVRLPKLEAPTFDGDIHFWLPKVDLQTNYGSQNGTGGQFWQPKGVPWGRFLPGLILARHAPFLSILRASLFTVNAYAYN